MLPSTWISIFFRAQLPARCFAFLLRSNKDVHSVLVSQSIGIFVLLLCFLALIMLSIESRVSCYTTELQSRPSMNDKLLPYFITHIFLMKMLKPWNAKQFIKSHLLQMWQDKGFSSVTQSPNGHPFMLFPSLAVPAPFLFHSKNSWNHCLNSLSLLLSWFSPVSRVCHSPGIPSVRVTHASMLPSLMIVPRNQI